MIRGPDASLPISHVLPSCAAAPGLTWENAALLPESPGRLQGCAAGGWDLTPSEF